MEKKILNEFIKTNPKLWTKNIIDDLKKLGYNEIPKYNSKENITIEPFYTDNIKSIDSKYPNSWSIAQKIDVNNSLVANSKALELIKKGANSIHFNIQNNSISLEDLLNKIPIEKTELFFKTKSCSNSFLKSLNKLAKDSKSFNISYDPIGLLAKSGNWECSMDDDLNSLKNKTNLLTSFKNLIVVESGLYQNAGANIFEEIAFSLSHANEYLNFLNGDVANKIAFNISIGPNYFFEIAKLKAFKILWEAITNKYKNTVSSPHIIATPSKRNKTIYEYNNNILRTTTECMSAIFGGANTISNITYDNIFNIENEFSKRIALNQLLIIKHETNIDKVKNAADGSHYINDLTNIIAQESLIIFKEIEKNGGFIKSLEKNIIQSRIKKSHKVEQKLFNEAKEKLIGINIYSDLDRKIKPEITKDILKPKIKINTIIEPVSEIRLAEKIELSRINNE